MLLLKQNHGQGTGPCQPQFEVFCAGGVVMSGETLTATARRVGIAAISLSLLLIPSVVFAQSPWERAASNLERTFTGPLARSLALVAIVLGGLMFMFGEAGAKRQISGIVFGGGLALFAAQFLTWLF
jgi:type IV secretory pathway VirB2 component (pilin)